MVGPDLRAGRSAIGPYRKAATQKMKPPYFISTVTLKKL